jgi:hypothetical protein
MKEGITMKVCHSTTSTDEKHTDRDLARQWNSINWKKVRSTVNRLQIRIAKATQEGKWNLVKRLGYLLTHSSSAKYFLDRKERMRRQTPWIQTTLSYFALLPSNG